MVGEQSSVGEESGERRGGRDVPREDLEAIITGDLLALIEVARQVIAERQHLPEGAPSLKVVGHGRCGCEERVEMDPVLDWFAGVLFELLFDGQRYVLAETALGTGNRLLCFRSSDRKLACAIFEEELPNRGASRVA